MGKLFKREKDGPYCGYIRYASGSKGRKRVSTGTTNRQCAEAVLKRLQADADKLREGILTPEHQRLQLPLAKLVELYGDHLAIKCSSHEHIWNTPRLLQRLFDGIGWTYWRQVTQAGIEKYLKEQTTKAGSPWTEAYCNTFIKAVKAFTRWATPSGMDNPLSRLTRFSMRNARHTKAKRAATREERTTLMRHWETLPWDRKASYTLAMLNGLRRNEIEKLVWEDLCLNAPVPFIRNLKQKMGSDIDQIPLHPSVVSMLQARMSEALPMPSTNVVKVLPDSKTVIKDVKRAGVGYKDKAESILSLHALRHTFCTMLGETPGITGAIAKALMRHSRATVTDSYTHVELAAMREALDKLIVTAPEHEAQQIKTGTGGSFVFPATHESLASDWHQIWHHFTSHQPGLDRFSTSSEGMGRIQLPSPDDGAEAKKSSVFPDDLRGSVLRLLSQATQAATISEPWPDTQVD